MTDQTTPDTADFLVFRLAHEVPALLAALDTDAANLADAWATARHEARAAVILWRAWQGRRHAAPADDTPAGALAHQVHAAARDLDVDPRWERDMWFGAYWPLWPLPDVHGPALADLAHDRGAGSLAVARALDPRTR